MYSNNIREYQWNKERPRWCHVRLRRQIVGCWISVADMDGLDLVKSGWPVLIYSSYKRSRSRVIVEGEEIVRDLLWVLEEEERELLSLRPDEGQTRRELHNRID